MSGEKKKRKCLSFLSSFVDLNRKWMRKPCHKVTYDTIILHKYGNPTNIGLNIGLVKLSSLNMDTC